MKHLVIIINAGWRPLTWAMSCQRRLMRRWRRKQRCLTAALPTNWSRAKSRGQILGAEKSLSKVTLSLRSWLRWRIYSYFLYFLYIQIFVSRCWRLDMTRPTYGLIYHAIWRDRLARCVFRKKCKWGTNSGSIVYAVGKWFSYNTMLVFYVSIICLFRSEACLRQKLTWPTRLSLRREWESLREVFCQVQHESDRDWHPLHAVQGCLQQEEQPAKSWDHQVL